MVHNYTQGHEISVISQLKSECPNTLKMEVVPPLKVCLFEKDKREYVLGQEAARRSVFFLHLD